MRKPHADRAFFTREDESRVKDDPVKLALMYAALGEYSVPGLMPFGGNDELLMEHDVHPWDNGAYVVYDSIARCWVVVCEECGFVATTTPGSLSIDAGIGTVEEAADMQTDCEPNDELRAEVAAALALVDAALTTVPHVIMTKEQQVRVYTLLGYDVEDIPAKD